MSRAAQVLAVVIAATLVSVWVMESFLYRHPRLYPLFLTKPADFDAVRLWTVNLGFYNLTTAVALVAGVVLVQTDHLPHGEALIIFTAAQHVFLAVVLVLTQRKLWLNTLMEGIPAAILLVLALN
jgi:putative membrane protein